MTIKFIRPNKWYFKLLITFSILVLVFRLVPKYITKKHIPDEENSKDKEQECEMKFGDNYLGYSEPIVPNTVHFVRFGPESHYLDFVSFISIKSVLINQRPQKIFIHCDCTRLYGKYWQRIREEKSIVVRYVPMPSHVFGRELSTQWQVWHASDVVRLEILMMFGGIYLDNDVYVLKSLDKFRVFEMCIGWDPDSAQPLGNQVLIAHRDARFLSVWLNSYHMYDPNQWYYNAGALPSKVLTAQPQLVHRVNTSFGISFELSQLLYNKFEQKVWDSYDLHAIHLLYGHRNYLDKNYNKTKEFDEYNIRRSNTKFAELARIVCFGSGGLFR